MATMKRRIIYLSDEQWADLQAQARGERTTISNLIRHGLALVPESKAAEGSPVEFRYLRAGQKADRERAAFVESVKETAQTIAAKIPVPAGMEARFNTQPFTPVPKRGK